MITVISPAKTLDFSEQRLTKDHSTPAFLDDSQELIDVLSRYSSTKISNLMGVSDKIADLNAGRYQSWQTPFTPENAKAALLAFKGDVYTSFTCEDYKKADFNFAQKHLRILSGLYGVLRPLDLIQPYRLEMGTKLKTGRGNTLYAFWGTMITAALNDDAKTAKAKALVNLASNEYFSSIRPETLDIPVVTPIFKDAKNGKYKVISFFAKRARGSMADWIIRHRIKKPADLHSFDGLGYRYDKDSSTNEKPLFLREEIQ